MASWSQIARRIRVPMGFAFAAVYLWLGRPSAESMLTGAVFVTLGLVIRGAASGHVQKNQQLTMTGPYAHTRNPLYLGSIILAVGFALAARSWWIGATLVLIFLTIYVPVIRSEEAFLRAHFPEFENYARNVPRLLPRFTSFGNAPGSFSSALYWQHREYNATLGSIAIMAALAIKRVWFSH